jgi:hypothetical protein
MLLKHLSDTRRGRITTNAIIIAGLLATVFIRPESDFYSGIVAGTRIGLMLVVMMIVTRRMKNRSCLMNHRNP